MYDNAPTVDNNIAMEAQILMEFTAALECYVVFINASKQEDHVICKVQKETGFCKNKVERKLSSFIENHYLQAVTKKQIQLFQSA